MSPTHAREIATDEYGMGLQDLLRNRRETLVGILNGVDYREWNPETDPLIPVRYSRTRLHGKSLCKRALMKDLGLAGGALVTRLMTFMLYGTSPLDPMTWMAAAGIMVLAAMAAAVVPSLRAARVDPIVAIQAE